MANISFHGRRMLPKILAALCCAAIGNATHAQCLSWTSDVALGGQRPRPRVVLVDHTVFGTGTFAAVDLRVAFPDLAEFLRSGGQIIFQERATGNILSRLNLTNVARYQIWAAEPGVVQVQSRLDDLAPVKSLLPDVSQSVHLPRLSSVPRLRSFFDWRIIARLRGGLSALNVTPAEQPNSLLFGLDLNSFIDPTVQQVIGDDVNAVPVPAPLPGTPITSPVIPATLPGASTPPRDAADAIVTVSYETVAGPQRCNGIQFRSGFVLTNLHCILGGSNFLVHFGPQREILQGDSAGQWAGTRICPATPFPVPASFTAPRLDFAVLQLAGGAPADYASAVVSLDNNGTLLRSRLQSSGEVANARLVQIINAVTQVEYQADFKIGQRHVERPPTCSIRGSAQNLRSPSRYCPSLTLNGTTQRGDGISHTCDAQGGSSGSALFDGTEPVLLALHRAAGGRVVQQANGQIVDDRRNCAVPAADIAATLTQWGL